jgi:hypothetical protein
MIYGSFCSLLSLSYIRASLYRVNYVRPNAASGTAALGRRRRRELDALVQCRHPESNGDQTTD